MVYVQAGFSRKNPARQSAIIVLDGQDGVELLRGATDESGNFSFSLPPVAREHGLTIRVNAGEGHQNEWRLKPGECAAEQAAPQLAPQQALPRAQPQDQAQMLAARLDDGPTWRDIVGGLGWIFGLVGMGMAWRARVREKQRSGGR